MDTVLVSSVGPDQLRGTGDDGVHRVTDLGGARSVTFLDAPYLEDGVARPVALGPTSFLLTSIGPDGPDGADYRAVELDAEVVKSGLRFKAPM